MSQTPRLAVTTLSLYGALLAMPTPARAADDKGAILELDARTFLGEWSKTQNDGALQRYAALYAPDFKGVRRSGTKVVGMNRNEWLKDRERMFKAPMTVTAVTTSVTPGSGATTVRFVQEWSTVQFADVGSKQMTLRRAADGKPVIVAEELLCSFLTKKNGKPVVHGKAADKDIAAMLYPKAEFQALPKVSQPGCGPQPFQLWELTVRRRESMLSEGERYDIVVWNESQNPKENTEIGRASGGGAALVRRGERLWVDEAPNCSLERMLQVPKGFVLALSCGDSWRGNAETNLRVFRVSGIEVTTVATVTTLDDDDAGAGTYAYRAKVEYKDVDGNGISDIVITPIKRRNVEKKYPREPKILAF
jgi:hypothetical protein